jgi:hypothetical protein
MNPDTNMQISPHPTGSGSTTLAHKDGGQGTEIPDRNVKT